MKTHILLLLTIGLLVGCSKQESTLEPELDNLYYTSPLNLAGRENGNLTVSLQQLRDSRCPIDVICIQPGFVELTLLIAASVHSARVKAVFYDNARKDQPVSFKLGDKAYSLMIKSVKPHPKEGQQLKIEDYVVGLRISSR